MRSWRNTGFRIPLKVRVKSGIMEFTTALKRNQDGTVNRGLAEFFENSVPANATPEKGVSTRDVTIDPETKIWVRLFVPVAAESTDQTSGRRFPVVMYYHGGGFCFLTPASKRYDGFCRRIAGDLQVIVVSVHYRRAPEYKCPVAYDDSFQALEWLHASSATHLPPSADVGNCFLMGDDAGGNIVHHTGVRAADMADQLKPLSIAGLIMLTPFFGGEKRTPAERDYKNAPMMSLAAMDWYWKAFLPQGANRDYSSCNVLGPNGRDVSRVNLPPFFLATADWDILEHRDSLYASNLQRAGKDVTVAQYGPVWHCFFLMDDDEHFTIELLLDVNKFIVSKTNPPVESELRPKVRDIPRKVRVMSSIMKFSMALARNKDGIINRRLADSFEPRVRANRKPKNRVWTRDVTIDQEKKTWVRLFVPVDAESTDQTSGGRFSVVLYYHGGGFCFLTPDSKAYDCFCRRISREFQVIVVSVHYRRAPEHKFPVACDDSFEALEWLRNGSGDYLPRSADVGNCFLMGDSAGGNIVHHVGVKAADMSADLKPVSIRGLIMLQPLFGGEKRTRAEQALENAPMISVADTDWYWKAFLPDGVNRDHSACNVFGPNGRDISAVNLPPSFIATAEFDILQDRHRSYAENLRAAGKNVELCVCGRVWHTFFLMDDNGYWTKHLLLKVKHFIRSKTIEPAKNVLAPQGPLLS